MSCNWKLPDDFFDDYYEAINASISDIFGVTCELVFIEKTEVIDTNTYPNVPDNRSVNINRRKKDQQKRGNVTIKEVEVKEDFQTKIYWDSKYWTKLGGDIVAPDTGIQTIFFAKDLDRVLRAKYLIAHKGIAGEWEYKFSKFGEPVITGFGHNQYAICFWERAN